MRATYSRLSDVDTIQIPHYKGHPAVLVPLEAIDVEELEELLTESWAINAPARLVAAFAARRS